jgi:hypothetical protein
MTQRCGDRRHEDVLAIDRRERGGFRDGGADRVHRGYVSVRSLTCAFLVSFGEDVDVTLASFTIAITMCAY